MNFETAKAFFENLEVQGDSCYLFGVPGVIIVHYTNEVHIHISANFGLKGCLENLGAKNIENESYQLMIMSVKFIIFFKSELSVDNLRLVKLCENALGVTFAEAEMMVSTYNTVKGLLEEKCTREEGQ